MTLEATRRLTVITGPKGDPGPRGPVGPVSIVPGPAGPAGPAGTIHGTAVTGVRSDGEESTDWVAVPAGTTVTIYTMPGGALASGEVASMAALIEADGTAVLGFAHFERRISVKNVSGSVQTTAGGTSDSDVTTPAPTANVATAIAGTTAQIVISGSNLLVQCTAPGGHALQARATVSWSRGLGYAGGGGGGGGGVTVTGVFPSWAPLAAGKPVTITGTGFSGTPAVTINGVAATSVSVVSSTTITCLTGTGTVGSGVVSVAGTTGAAFTYVSGPIEALKSEDATNGGGVLTGSWTGWIAGNVWNKTGSPVYAASATIISKAHPAVRFDGSTNYVLNTSSFAKGQALECWVVLKQLGWTGYAYIVGGNGPCVLDQDGGGVSPALGLYAGLGPNTDNPNLALNTYGIVKAVYNGASSSITVNNGTVITGNPGTNGTTGGVALGAFTDGSGKSNVEIAAVVWVDPTAAGYSASDLYTALARDY